MLVNAADAVSECFFMSLVFSSHSHHVMCLKAAIIIMWNFFTFDDCACSFKYCKGLCVSVCVCVSICVCVCVCVCVLCLYSQSLTFCTISEKMPLAELCLDELCYYSYSSL